MSTNVTSATRVALCMAVGLIGCEELGNPSQQMTEPTRWSDAGAMTVTRSVSYSRRGEIKRRVARGFEGFHHSDPRIDAGEVLTLVEVTGRLAAPVPSVVKLLTAFELAGGKRVVKRWHAPTRARSWQAAFALSGAPRSATTEVVR